MLSGDRRSKRKKPRRGTKGKRKRNEKGDEGKSQKYLFKNQESAETLSRLYIIKWILLFTGSPMDKCFKIETSLNQSGYNVASFINRNY